MDWEEIYEKQARNLYIFLNRLCRDPEMAQDLLQETFVAALRGNPKSLENERAWLYKVAYRIFLKQKKKADRVFPASPEILRRIAPDERPRTDYRILREQILAFLESKKDRLAMVFHLRTEHDLSLAEIGRVLNISDRSVKRDMDKIRKLVRPFLSLEETNGVNRGGTTDRA